MKFKVGQKVCVKEWVGMSQNVVGIYSMTPPPYIGRVVIIRKAQIECEEQAYEIDFVDKELRMDGYLFFEKELEPLIKVGEQLLFSFME